MLPLVDPQQGLEKLTFENVTGFNFRLNSDLLMRLSKLCTNLTELTLVFTVDSVTDEMRDSFCELFERILSEIKNAQTNTLRQIIVSGLTKSEV